MIEECGEEGLEKLKWLAWGRDVSGNPHLKFWLSVAVDDKPSGLCRDELLEQP
jgi:hypothetical protein